MCHALESHITQQVAGINILTITDTVQITNLGSPQQRYCWPDNNMWRSETGKCKWPEIPSTPKWANGPQNKEEPCLVSYHRFMNYRNRRGKLQQLCSTSTYLSLPPFSTVASPRATVQWHMTIGTVKQLRQRQCGVVNAFRRVRHVNFACCLVVCGQCWFSRLEWSLFDLLYCVWLKCLRTAKKMRRIQNLKMGN